MVATSEPRTARREVAGVARLGKKTKLLVTKLDLHPVDSAAFAIPKTYKNLAMH